MLDRVALASPYSVDPCLQRLAGPDCGLAAADPYAASGAGAANAANASMYAGADAVFVGFGGDASKDVLFPATADPGPLNRAEWVKYAAAFFNKEVAANKIYDTVKASYGAIKAATAAARKRAGAPAAPVVAWVSTNASGVTFRLEPYKTQLIQVRVCCCCCCCSAVCSFAFVQLAVCAVRAQRKQADERVGVHPFLKSGPNDDTPTRKTTNKPRARRTPAAARSRAPRSSTPRARSAATRRSAPRPSSSPRRAPP